MRTALQYPYYYSAGAQEPTIQAFQTLPLLRPKKRDFVFLLLFAGQSNQVRGEAGRISLVSKYSATPPNVDIYWKPDYSGNDNGAFEPIEAGVNTAEQDIVPTYPMCGKNVFLSQLIENYTGKHVYVVETSDGGTSLHENPGIQDWYPTTPNEKYEIGFRRYYRIALQKVEAANPGKDIRVIFDWHQGESNVGDPAGYTTLWRFFRSSFRNDFRKLQTAPVLVHNLKYDPAFQTQEEEINTNMQAECESTTGMIFINTQVNYPRKSDLPTNITTAYPHGGLGNDNHNDVFYQAKASELAFVELLRKGYLN